MFGLCKYKNALGKPGKGLHRFRIANIAIVDVVFTMLLAYVAHNVFLKKHYYWIILAICFLLGIFMHRVFCVKTTIDKFLFS
jgi:hypothetical protein|tara:strand:+ start:640 stop:885 length:246 start_codon:yes stop_codon:yes gene_type:complete